MNELRRGCCFDEVGANCCLVMLMHWRVARLLVLHLSCCTCCSRARRAGERSARKMLGAEAGRGEEM